MLPGMNLTLRRRRWLIAVIAFFVVFTVSGFFILPPIVKAQAEQRISAELGRKVTIGKIRMNPYAVSMTIEQLNIELKDGTGSFLGWDRLYVNVDVLGSMFGDWAVSDIELDGAHLGVEILPSGALNFADVIAKVTALAAVTPGAPPPKPMRPIRVGSLKVNSARLEFKDLSRAKPFATVLGPVTFAVSQFRTVGASGAPYQFAATTEAGEKLTWSGTLSADPLESHGRFSLENLILAKYTPYLEDRVVAELTDGQLTVSGQYEAFFIQKQITLKLGGGEVHLRGLKIGERANGPAAVELPVVDVAGIEADAIALKATVGSVSLAGGRIGVRREKDGSINLLNLLHPPIPAAPSAAVPAAGPVAPAKLPDALVKLITVKDLKIEVTDLGTPQPAQLLLSNLAVEVKNATLADGAAIPVAASFTWAPQGTVAVSGSVTLRPELTADLKNEVTGFAILPLSPYLEQFVNARITQGTVTTTNTVHAALPAGGGRPVIALAGDVTVEKFGLVDGLLNEELAGFGSLTLKNLKAATSPQLAVSLDEVALTAPYARIIINGETGKPYLDLLKEADKHINLLAVAKPLTPTAAPAPATIRAASPAPAAVRPKVEVGRVVIAGGDFSFEDRAIEPHVRMAITQFGGTVAGLSSANLAKADVDLHGTVDGTGPVAITGKLDPFGAVRSIDLKVDFKNVDLLPVSPYAGKFAGFELARGQLVVDVKVTIVDRKLDSANVITLNQFTFGAATNSPEATGLPVRLGVALLKDTDGRIIIDFPVQGSLDDPDFRYGKVVMRVIGNLLLKAATSPFSLLGSMFGGGGDELAFQDFVPGESRLQPAEQPKLDTLIKALTNRPTLSLGIEGSFDATADAYALKRLKLADVVRRKIWETQHAANPNISPPDQLVISPEENAAMVKQLFNEKFPPGTKFGAPLAEAPVVAAPPPPPPPGLFKRVVKIITFAEQREKTAAKKAEAQRVSDREQALTVAAEAGLPLEEMTGRLAETMPVDDNDLRALATARAQRVRDQLITVGRIGADRLFLSQSPDPAKQNKGPRVFLNLQ